MTKQIHIKTPDMNWLYSYLGDGLKNTPGYHLDAPEITIKLDQNESPWDWPQDVKKAISGKLLDAAWNRYPSPYPDKLVGLVADYVGVKKENILLSPGSNHLLSLIINGFGHALKGKLVLARPSFPLYESHSRYMGFAYEPWELNDNLEYDFEKLPALTPGSMVVFASPNNPTGNILSYANFEELLKTYPEVLFVADEAYYEFAENPYTDLLEIYSNLIIVRTFSKTLGTAGLRLGYMLAAQEYVREIKKLMLPYTINVFTNVAMTYIFENNLVDQLLTRTVENAKIERNYLYDELVKISDSCNFTVKPSEANFFLMRWQSQELCEKYYKALIARNIIVRNVSKGPLLEGCLRVTVGTREQNETVVSVIKSCS